MRPLPENRDGGCFYFNYLKAERRVSESNHPQRKRWLMVALAHY
jgi:hypothetical protein